MGDTFKIRPVGSQRGLDAMHALYREVFPADLDPGPLALSQQKRFIRDVQNEEPRTQSLHLVPEDLFVHLGAYAPDGELVGALTSEVDVRSVVESLIHEVPPRERFLVPLLKMSRSLSRLAVSPSHRRVGIATALVDAAREIHLKHGVAFWYGVIEQPETEEFFRSVGFEVYVEPGFQPGQLLVEVCTEYVVPFEDTGVAAMRQNLVGDPRWMDRAPAL